MELPEITIEVINTANGRRAYKEQVENSINSVFDIVGNAIDNIPEGPKGDTGDRGPQGIQGPQGNPGTPGASATVVEFTTDAAAQAHSQANPLAIVVSTEGF